MRADTYIERTFHQDEVTGKISYSYKWGGGKVAPLNASIAIGVIGNRGKMPKVFCLGALRLRLVLIDRDLPGMYVMLDGWQARIWSAIYPAVNLLNIIGRKLLLTAYIWGMMTRIEPGLMPTWMDLRPVKFAGSILRSVRRNGPNEKKS